MLIFDETVTIRPKPNQPAIVIQQAQYSSYGHLQWVDAEGKFMASIMAHRATNDDITHNHMSISLADPSAKNGRRGKVDLQLSVGNDGALSTRRLTRQEREDVLKAWGQ